MTTEVGKEIGTIPESPPETPLRIAEQWRLGRHYTNFKLIQQSLVLNANRKLFEFEVIVTLSNNLRGVVYLAALSPASVVLSFYLPLSEWDIGYADLWEVVEFEAQKHHDCSLNYCTRDQMRRYFPDSASDLTSDDYVEFRHNSSATEITEALVDSAGEMNKEAVTKLLRRELSAMDNVITAVSVKTRVFHGGHAVDSTECDCAPCEKEGSVSGSEVSSTSTTNSSL